MKLFNYTDLRTCLTQVGNSGLGIAEGILNRNLINMLLTELSQLKFSDVDENLGPIKQKFSKLLFSEIPNSLQSLTQLKKETEALIHSNAGDFPSLKNWLIKESIVQKYTSADGISTHVDLKRHPYIVVLFNITGSCIFDILESRDGLVTKTAYPKPGDMLILRAPGFNSPTSFDNRPYHRVSGNMTSDRYRISIGFRDNLYPNKPFPKSY